MSANLLLTNDVIGARGTQALAKISGIGLFVCFIQCSERQVQCNYTVITFVFCAYVYIYILFSVLHWICSLLLTDSRVPDCDDYEDCVCVLSVRAILECPVW